MKINVRPNTLVYRLVLYLNNIYLIPAVEITKNIVIFIERFIIKVGPDTGETNPKLSFKTHDPHKKRYKSILSSEILRRKDRNGKDGMENNRIKPKEIGK